MTIFYLSLSDQTSKTGNPKRLMRIIKCVARMLKHFRKEMFSYGLTESTIDYAQFTHQLNALMPLVETGWFRKLWISSWASPFQICGFLGTGEFVYFRSRNGKHYFSVSRTPWHKEPLYSRSFHTQVHRRGEDAEELSELQATAIIADNLKAYFATK